MISRSSASRAALRNATVIGTLLQLAMVLAGHWVDVIRLRGFAGGGMLISAVAGVIYARMSRAPRGISALNGAIAGGVCGLIGIAVSVALGDTAAPILAIGTIGSAVAGAIAGVIAGGAT
jgi:hypothetical protein